MGYMVGVAAMLAAFYFTPASMPKLQWATVFMIGFFLYGPQMLIGLCGAELARPDPNLNLYPDHATQPRLAPARPRAAPSAAPPQSRAPCAMAAVSEGSGSVSGSGAGAGA